MFEFMTAKINGRPPLYETPEKLQSKIDEYFATTPRIDVTITGLVLHLGFSHRQSLSDYEKRNENFSDIIKTAKTRVENSYEVLLKDPLHKPTGAIFALKNMGWKDEVQNNSNVSLDLAEQSTQDIARNILFALQAAKNKKTT